MSAGSWPSSACRVPRRSYDHYPRPTTLRGRRLVMSRNQSQVSRRDFARFLALSGSVFLPARARAHPLLAWPAPVPQTPDRPGEEFWMSVRRQFLMPPELGILNAANLCPSPAPVLEAMYRSTKDID